MHVLVVAATAAEVAPLTAAFSSGSTSSHPLVRLSHPRYRVDLLVTGVGMVATAVRTARALAETSPAVAINLGVCGSFTPAAPPGSVVHVVSDALSEQGVEDGDGFLSLQDLGLLGADEHPFRGGRLVNAAPPALPTLSSLPQVDGITVNTAHGHEPSIRRVVERFRPDVESMEGAAFFYACFMAGVPCAQVRAVSNRVERRDRSAWALDEAVSSLSGVATRLLDEL